MKKEKEERKEDGLGEIDLNEFKVGFGSPGVDTGEESKEATPGEEGEEEPKEEPGYTEVSLSTQMLVGMLGFALSMRYLPDKKAVKAFNQKYNEELPKIIESFGMKEVFDQICATTLTFKIKETDALNIPLPGWVGLVAVIGVLVVAGLVIKVPTTKNPKTHKDLRDGEEYGLTDEAKKKEKDKGE